MFHRLVKYAVLTLVATVALSAILGWATWFWVDYSLDKPLDLEGKGVAGIDGVPLAEGSSSVESVVLIVQKGMGLSALSRYLAQEGFIASHYPLAIYSRCCVDGVIQAGEYRIGPGESSRDLLKRLLAGDVIRYKITFPEGLTLSQWLSIMQEDPALNQDSQSLNEQLAMWKTQVPGNNLEGWFFPDTYIFQRGDSVLSVLSQAHQRMLEILHSEWESRDTDLPIGSPYEALILASIVEKETGVPEERPMIAGVFIRRLEKGMRLQTDPTVIYGLGERFQGNLTRKHLKESTPYNTYVINGLPPTPIANPGQGAIRAVLQPEQGDSLYFVAKGDGSHYFSKTHAEHLQAVRKYQLQRNNHYRSAPQDK